MNGVRRFLAAATSSSPTTSTGADLKTSTTSPALASSPSWPPVTESFVNSLPQPAPLVPRKDGVKQRPQPPSQATVDDALSFTTVPNNSTPGSPASILSLCRLPNDRTVKRKSPLEMQSLSEVSYKRITGGTTSTISTIRDELLMGLLASEALVDSRDLEILTSEQVDEYKKEHQVLTTRMEALSKKLALEIKIRDAAASLAKVNAAHKKASNQTDEQLEVSNRRVDVSQKEYWQILERAHEVNKKLMDHRAGVLSYSLRSMEQKVEANGATAIGNVRNDDRGYGSSSRSTLSSETASPQIGKARFDGPHLFAGHADTIVPRRLRYGEEAAVEIAAVEAKLKAAADALTTAGKKQAEMARELSVIRLEKQEVEVLMAMDLQTAEETIHTLEKELPRLKDLDQEVQQLRDEKEVWERERSRFVEQMQQVKDEQSRRETQEMLEASEKTLRQKEDEIQRITTQWHAEKSHWERQKAELEGRSDDAVRFQKEVEVLKDERDKVVQRANEELNNRNAQLETFVKHHGITLFSRDTSLQELLSSFGAHLTTVHTKLEASAKAEIEWEASRKKLEGDIKKGLTELEALSRDIEDARRERDEARNDMRNASHATVYKPSGLPDSVEQILQILIPIWNILPSPETRATKFNQNRAIRAVVGPGTSPMLGSPSQPGSPSGSKTITSLSELDVRSLKSLYDSTRGGSSMSSAGGGDFSIEAFALRVQAVIQDDRALIERLVRFAQAHDLLKKNAERAQKLAQEGTIALETYQRQVRTLEERNSQLVGKITDLQDALEILAGDKRQLEHAIEQEGERNKQLIEANSSINARMLRLAAEAAASDELRKTLEVKLAETRAELEAVRTELEETRMSEQTQRIALLDALNSSQSENAELRDKLRARK